MRTLQLDEISARSLYKTSFPEFKIVLENSFGKDFFNEKITDRIKTYQDSCKDLDTEPISDDYFQDSGLTEDEIAFRKIKAITKSLNEGWKPDWNNSNEKKWYPWFKLSSGGFVFDDAGYCCSVAGAGHGSRLCFKSEELAEYAGKQFIDIWIDIIQK